VFGIKRSWLVTRGTDQQALPRAGEVADSKPAIGVAPGHVVPGPDVGGSGVDPQAEQAAGGQVLLCGADVSVRGSAVAVLEDLDPDDDRVDGRSRQSAEVAADEAVSAFRGAGGELGDGGGRDIHAGQV